MFFIIWFAPKTDWYIWIKNLNWVRYKSSYFEISIVYLTTKGEDCSMDGNITTSCFFERSKILMLHIFITRYTWNPHFPSRFWKSIRPVKKGTVLVCFSRTSIFVQKLQNCSNYITLNHEKMQNFLKPGKISRFSRKISTTLVEIFSKNKLLFDKQCSIFWS